MIHILPKIKTFGFDLGLFNHDSVVLEINAENPDDACYLAYKNFCDHIIEQSPSIETKNVLKELKDFFIVFRLIKQ